MIKETLIGIGIAVLMFEFAEHVVLPLIWTVTHRKKRPLVGVESMIGEEVEVRTWEGSEGQVFFRGVLWRAASDDRLSPGDRAVIEGSSGLTLRVRRWISPEAAFADQQDG